MTKYGPISLLNTAAKVLEKVLITRVMHVYSNNLMIKNQYGFTPQTSTVDAVMALTFIAQHLNPVFVLAVRSFLHDGPLNAQYTCRGLER